MIPLTEGYTLATYPEMFCWIIATGLSLFLVVLTFKKIKILWLKSDNYTMFVVNRLILRLYSLY